MRAIVTVLLALLATTAPAFAQQRFVSLDYKFGTDSDYVVLLDLNAVRRGGDISDALATIVHVESFFRADGRPSTRRWLRIQHNCGTRELRLLNLDSATHPDASLTGPSAVSGQPPQTVPEGAEIDRAMCSQQGLRAHWPLLNSSLMEAPETRKPVNPDATRFPWATLEGAVESFVRVRVRQAMEKAYASRPDGPKPERVTGLPYPVPGLVFTPMQLRYADNATGLHLVDQGYVDMGSVTRLDADLFIYTVLAVPRTAQSLTSARHPQVEIAVEVRCKPGPAQQRIVNLETTTGDQVKVTALAGVTMRWSPNLTPFSQGLCTGQFDTTAKTHAALAPAMAELTAMVQAAARQ